LMMVNKVENSVSQDVCSNKFNNLKTFSQLLFWHK